MTLSLEKDIEILKNLLRIEKNINKKDQSRIQELEQELKTFKQESEQTTLTNSQRINELEI